MRPPAMTALLVGSGDFVKIGSDIRDDLISKCRLSPTAAVLEIGCGYGRVAVALTSYLDQTGKYDGIDVVKDATDWCEKEISSRYPNFRFLYADVRACIKTNSLIYMTMEPASSRLLAD